MEIEYDEDKRAITLLRRRLDFADAGRVFAGVVVEYEDDRFDYSDIRLMTVGMLYGKVVVVVSIDRGHVRRVISLRLATKVEQDEYFERVG